MVERYVHNYLTIDTLLTFLKVVPFLTGLLAQAVGTFVLHPVCIGFFVLMLGCWAVLPKWQKRQD